MRHIAKLSLIFFLALTAQANADTTIICKRETRGAPPTPMVITYYVYANGEITNLRGRNIPSCPKIMRYNITKDQISVYCHDLFRDDELGTTVVIDRYTGQYQAIEKQRGDNGLKAHNGLCSKVKRKF